MDKEFDLLLEDGVFELVKKPEVPQDARVFPAVWSMKRKRQVLTQMIYNC